MKIVKNFNISVIAVVIMLLITQCTNPNKSAKSDSGLLNVELDDKGLNAFENSFSAPSPEEVMSLFEDSGLKFTASALNDPKNIDRYITSKSLSCNLGVYVTDAAYLNMFQQYMPMTGYLESIFEITDKLEVSGIYQEFDFKKVFKEMDNADSLIVLSEGVNHAVTNYLIENNKETMLCLITHGSFIELLYLTLESMDGFNADDPILQSISDQHMQLDNLYEYAMQFDENADIHEMLTQLSAINDIWSQIEHSEKSNLVSKSSDGKMQVEGGVKHKFTAEQFNKLKVTIKEIRNKITS